MEVNNPYIHKKRELIVQIDKEEQIPNPTQEQKDKLQIMKQELEDLEYKSRTFTQSIIDEYASKIEKIREKSKVIKKEYPSLNKQYKATIELHREAKSVANEIKKFKLDLINELKISRKKREPQQSSNT